ncbi:hypothetical protein [Franzmannia qiaohouensis]|uniref:Uncharacterized protein n=1 Tax=Franzmannia qiaohouensis TaxID=1329370 RepID=A0ABU1HGI8_9GAMM|nr:hypothetical protein [Halomonas qiaohouensis]MDR5906590.1 hypothetical protein [Halomonas qiaohouensis]
MKYATIIMQAVTAGVLVMGLAAQATAADATQTRFEVGSPALGGTREGVHEYRVEAAGDQASESQGAQSYRTTFEVGSPALGGTREGVYRERVEADGNQRADQQIDQHEYAGPAVGNPTQGTSG